MLKAGNQKKGTATPEQIAQREERRRKMAEADAKRELAKRRLTKSGQPQSGLVDTDETEYQGD